MTAGQLADGTLTINASSVAAQGLVPGLPCAVGPTKKLVSRLLGPADLSGVSFLLNPLDATLSCRNVITAYDTAPVDLNNYIASSVASVASVGLTGASLYAGQAGTQAGLRTIVGGDDIKVEVDGTSDEIVISSTAPDANDVSIVQRQADALAPPGVASFFIESTGPANDGAKASTYIDTLGRWLFGGSGTGIRYSDDGGATLNTALASVVNNYTMAWSPTLGIAAARSDSGTPDAQTSPNGLGWTQRPAPVALAAANTKMAWISPYFICGSATPGVTIDTSPDGIAWTPRFAARNVLDLAERPGGGAVSCGLDGFMWSADPVSSWTNAGGPSGAVGCVTIARVNDSTLVGFELGLSSTAHVSTDGGATWAPYAEALPFPVRIRASFTALNRTYVFGIDGTSGLATTAMCGFYTGSSLSNAPTLPLTGGRLQAPAVLAPAQIYSAGYDPVFRRFWYGMNGGGAGFFYHTPGEAAAVVATSVGTTPATSQTTALQLNTVTGAALFERPGRGVLALEDGLPGPVLMMYYGGVGYPLGGPGAGVARRFDGTLTDDLFDDGEIVISWVPAFRQLRYTCPNGTFYGAAMSMTTTTITTNNTVENSALSPTLALGIAYYVANNATTRSSLYDLSGGSRPFRAEYTIAPATGLGTATPSYWVDITITPAGLGDLRIRKQYSA